MAKKLPKVHVIRDTREQEQGDRWYFPESTLCAGTIDRTMKTADYTLEGFEDVFVIERKAGTAEIAQNICQDRFVRELERLEEFKYPFIIAGCTWEEVYAFPEHSGIPKSAWPKLRVTNHFMVKRLCEYQLRYKTKIILAGIHAQDVAKSLFKRILEQA